MQALQLILPIAGALAGVALSGVAAGAQEGEVDQPLAVYVEQPTVAASMVDARIIGNVHGPSEAFTVRIGNLGEDADRAVVSWPVSLRTGFDPAPGGDPSPYQRGPTATAEGTAVQVRGQEIGIWIDSDLPRPLLGTLIPVCPAYWWWDLQRAPWPFAEAGRELAFRFDLKVPTATRENGAEVYLCAYFLFRDVHSGRSLWYGASVLDLRGSEKELVHVDNWEGGTGLPILLAALRGGSTWLHPAKGSSEAQSEPFSEYRRFEFRVGAAELLNGLAALRQRFPQTAALSTDPAAYQLVHINLNPEVHAPPGGRGRIGLACRELRVALHATPEPRQGPTAADAEPPAPAPAVYRLRIVPWWFADNTRFWYRNDLAGGAREFVVVDALAGLRGPAFDHARAAAALSALTGHPITAEMLPLSHIAFEDAEHIVLRGRDGAWRLDLATYEALALAPGDEAGAPRLPATTNPRPSRHGGEETSIAFDNRLTEPVELFWLDWQTQRKSYGILQPGQRREQHTFARHVWFVATPQDRAVWIFEAEDRPSSAVIEGTPAAKEEPAAADRPADDRPWGPRSADGRLVVFARDHNLWLYETAGGRETALSSDGSPAASYSAQACWWSADSSRLAAVRSESAPVRQVTLVESSPADQVQPKVHTFPYPKPGDLIERPQPRLFDVPRRTLVPIAGDPCPNPWSLGDVRWAADSSRFTFVYNQRGHQVLQVLAVDAASGQVTVLVDERSDTFICYSGKYFCAWIGDGELVWMSERDGWNHLWLYDAQTGTVKNQITRGEWVVQGVESVDPATRQVVFRAGGVHPGQDPYYTHWCRIGLDGSGLTLLTEGDGTHDVAWSPDGRFFIDTYSRVDLPPVHELRRADSGALVCRLEEADAKALVASGLRWPERFQAKGRDGHTQIYGLILRPTGFDPARRYPVVEDIYAGPQAHHVPKAFAPRHGQQALADRGFIVVRIDGMGTSGRSKAFHDVCWRNLRDAGFPDRIAWLRAAAAEHPEMDLSRLGIYGGSAGGQNALAALLWHGDFYRVAVADCGCHDNRMDKLWWNEQWLGWPVGAQYEENSNVVHAQRLQGKLLLIVGELDRNVDPASTLQVASALVKANKDFELLVLPGQGHGAAETAYGNRRRTDFLVRHLLAAGR